MSQKHTLNTLALTAVLAGAIFVVALMLFMFLADYQFFASFFLAGLLAFLSGIVLFLGFGSPEGQTTPVVTRAAAPAMATPPPAPAPAPAPEPAPVETGPTPEEEAEAAKAAEFKAAAEAEAARMETAKKAAEAEATAARKKAQEEAAAAAAAEKEAQAAAAQQAAADAEMSASDAQAGDIPDYDGDGKLEGTNEGSRPAGIDSPRDGQADDLKQIKGIGPKLEKLCNSLGFWHFDQVAAWSSDEIAWVDANLEGFKGRVTRDKWVDQAKVLATGGETEFSKRVEDGDVY